jgi:subtilisin family serine protease
LKKVEIISMGKWLSTLTAAIDSKSTKRSQRKIIIFKDNKSYHQCVRFLKNKNITPLKQVKSARMVCIHIKSEKHVHEISKHPSIHRVETDIAVKAHGGSPKRSAYASSPKLNIPWGIRRIRAPKVWPISLGEGVRIGIIDTGIGPNHDVKVFGGINTINRQRSFRDNNGHGTFVAGVAAARGNSGTIAGAAPLAKLYAVKALDAFGNGFVSDIIEGIEWCIQHRMHVINMSLGLNQHSSALQQSIRKAYRKGIVIVASAGNNGSMSGGIDEPAKYPEVIAVASSNIRNQISNFSSRGKGIDITAPGENIRSLRVGKGTVIESGTSFSSPHAAGSTALLLHLRPNLTPRRVRHLLT